MLCYLMTSKLYFIFMLYNMCHVMLYNICYVMTSKLYFIAMCHVMLYNMCHVMLYNMPHVMLYNICHVMLYNSWRNPLYLNHVIDSIFRSCGNVLYLFRLPPIQRRLSGFKNKSLRVSRAFTQPSCKVFQCFNIEAFQSRIIELTSCENSQATKCSWDFCMT